MASDIENTTPAEAALKAWYAYKFGRKFEYTESEIREAFGYAFRYGARYNARLSGQMSPHMARFAEYVMWLGITEDLDKE